MSPQNARKGSKEKEGSSLSTGKGSQRSGWWRILTLSSTLAGWVMWPIEQREGESCRVGEGQPESEG